MNDSKKVPVITIDGPSGTGKGTICKLLAKHLNWNFLDSGALYRALAYVAVKKDISLDNAEQLAQLAENLNLEFQLEDDKEKIIFEDEDISLKIRSERCGQNASTIAVYPNVRDALLERQRTFAKMPGLITDGRDMGSVVFPDAELKVYLDASTEERARRRYLQLKKKGNNVSLAEVVDELVKRDKRDTLREASPLKPAVDSEIIDTTYLNITQVFNYVLKLVEERFNI